jgi:AraC-like DNA-binding protein
MHDQWGKAYGPVTINPGPDEKVYPVAKIAIIVSALQAEGITPAQALERVDLSDSDLVSYATRVSLNQVIQCYRNAIRLSTDPHFTYRAGERFHVSTYGMYGFALLSSTDFRQTMRFVENYHQLATPTAQISFKEQAACAEWTLTPALHPGVDATLYRFLVELQFSVLMTLQRDFMGPSFQPRELHVTYGPTSELRGFSETSGCRILFGQAKNKFIFDATWLDEAPKLGNPVSYALVLSLCDRLMEELQLRVGFVGKVREALLLNLARPTSFNVVAKHAKVSTRTLRRKLLEEKTSFREVVDELRMQMAIKYLRDTNLTVEEIAFSLGFSETSSFRQAFRRWTKATPNEFRRLSNPSGDD